MKRTFLLIISITLLTFRALPQEIQTDKVYNNSIKTVLLHRESEPLSHPVIHLNGNEKLQLSFDDLSEDVENYSYTLIHCNSEWRESKLYKSDYIDGFEEYNIEKYEFSFNTNIPYINYQLTIPNEFMRLKLSGNYILMVFNGSQSDTVLTKRFYVVENQATIKADIHRALNPNFAEKMQEIDLEVEISQLYISNPYTEIKALVMQNFRSDNSKVLYPNAVNGYSYKFNYESENLFEGGNEFKHLDAKNIHFKGVRTQDIYYKAPYYHFVLLPEQFRKTFPYQYEEDINGKFLIHTEQQGESNINSDYIMADFQLPTNEPITGGELYVFGALSMWQMQKDGMMKYNFESRKYEVSLLLKQGYYNYQLVFVENKGLRLYDHAFIEGNHSETENEYTIFIYYADASQRYEKLIGYNLFSSIKRL